MPERPDPTSHISLAAPGDTTPNFRSVNSAAMAVSVIPSSWGTATLELEWSLDGETFHSFSAPVTFDTDNEAVINVNVTSTNWLRLRVTAADGTADTEAEVYMRGTVIAYPPFQFSPTGQLQQSDFMLEVSKGNIAKHSTVLVRGHNPAFAAAAGFVDVAEQGDLTYLTTAETMEVTSDDANDTAAGTGLRTLLIAGVDDDGVEVSETITMDGTNDVTTVNTYLRVNFMTGLTAGSTGWNEGSVTATATTAATIQSEMDATESISQGSHYTVPLGNTLYVYKAEFNVARISAGSDPVIEFKGYARPGGAGAAWLQLFDKRFAADVSDELDVIPSFPAPLIARSDVRFRADTDVNNTEVRTRLYGILVED